MSLIDQFSNTSLICLTIDVEWACAEVLADICQLLAERELAATFFCTHADISVPGHERALHPNFRRQGEMLRQLRAAQPDFGEWDDERLYHEVIMRTRQFAPEAVGVRTHSLIHDITMMRVFQHAGLEYDSSYYLPRARGLAPSWKEYQLLEFPIYYMDYFELLTPDNEFNLAELQLDTPGLKVLDFHPNIVYLNAAIESDYQRGKAHYHDAAQLRRLRNPHRGARTLFIELLDHIKHHNLPTSTLAQLNSKIRTEC